MWIAGEPTILACVDATRLRQAVGNLLHNASKHSPAGASIELVMQRSADRAIIKVTDPGIGIPKAQLERIFAMFGKVEGAKPGTSEGLGIGLALARQLAVLHGGTLTASSRGEGLGATFELVIPIGEVAAPRTAHAPPPSASGEGTTSVGLRVLLVEDNDDSAELMGRWLKRLGCEVRTTPSGLSALALISDFEPEMVLCDLGLPDIDGIELARRVRAELKTPPTMIAVTGWGTAEDRRRTKEVGFVRHLVKPVALEELRAVMATMRRVHA